MPSTSQMAHVARVYATPVNGALRRRIRRNNPQDAVIGGTGESSSEFSSKEVFRVLIYYGNLFVQDIPSLSLHTYQDAQQASTRVQLLNNSGLFHCINK